ncbi:MAG: long-chain fatty acid--CoA ligase [Smithella sp.]|jgi:long-chain acyl-CoA synthetase
MYDLPKPDNLLEFLENSIANHPDNPLFGVKDTKTKEYEWIPYKEIGRRVDNLRGGLAKIGIKKGDAVGIIANNRPEFAICAFAAYGLVARFVPMYEQELPHIWKYIIKDSSIKVLFISNHAIYEQIKKYKKDLTSLKQIYVIDDTGENSMAVLEKIGTENPTPSIRPSADDIAVLIYTSGTTGDPKGVLLSHGNLTSNSHTALSNFPGFSDKECVLAILPWAHLLGQLADLYNFIKLGASIGLVENVTTISEDIEKVKPTFLIAVPRIFNRIYDGLWTKMNETGGLARMLFVMGIESGKKRRELAEKGKTSVITYLKFKIADKVVFSKIRKKFGGRLKGALTASAAMNPDIAKFFIDLGIPTYDCYGMTETSPAITVNSPSGWKLGSVGRVIDGVRVVIDKSVVEEGAVDGEIICYGPNVMKGYHNKPDATRDAMTQDGGMRTGDRGRLDKEGYLFITGRIKEQYKLENGKFVFPSAIEEELKLVHYIEHAMIYGENKPYNICLIVLDSLLLEKYAEKHEIEHSNPAELIHEKEIKDMIIASINARLKGKFGGYEIPKKFLFLTEGFTMENGMLTQTLKLKRRIVLQHYAKEIEELYKN